MQEFQVDQQSAAVAAMSEPWPTIDALVGGTLTMRKAGTALLPQFPKEHADDYAERLGTAVLLPAFSRTTEVLAAKPFARPMTIEKVSKQVEGFYDNVDMLGTDIHAFCGQALTACLRYGIHGVLVDSPRAEGARTVAEQRKAGVRPYMKHYPCASILGWRAEHNAEGAYLTQLRLFEEVTEPDGAWGEKIIAQVRVLTPGKWEIWRRATTSDGTRPLWELFDSGVTGINAVPFVFFYGLRQEFGIGKPPMLDLAYMNVEHWQSSSDQQTLLHTARVPILFGKGFAEKEKVFIGSKSATMTKNTEAELRYVEHSGAAIEAGRQSIHDLEDRMREVGAELLTERQGEVTAQQVNSEDEDNRSTLQKIVEEFEDSLERVLQLMDLWVGQKSDPEVVIYKDFASADTAGRTGDLLLNAVDRKVVSRETAREHLKRADVLRHDLDEELETQRLQGEASQDLETQKKTAEIGAAVADKPGNKAKK